MKSLSNKEIASVAGGVPFLVVVLIVDLALIAATAAMQSGAEEQAAETDAYQCS